MEKYSEEEKKAIGWLSALDVKSEYEATNKETLLNLIEKQQKEIEEQKFKRSFKNGEISVEHNGVKYIREDFVISKEKIRKIIDTRPPDLAIFKIITILGETDDR